MKLYNSTTGGVAVILPILQMRRLRKKVGRKLPTSKLEVGGGTGKPDNGTR